MGGAPAGGAAAGASSPVVGTDAAGLGAVSVLSTAGAAETGAACHSIEAAVSRVSDAQSRASCTRCRAPTSEVSRPLCPSWGLIAHTSFFILENLLDFALFLTPALQGTRRTPCFAPRSPWPRLVRAMGTWRPAFVPSSQILGSPRQNLVCCGSKESSDGSWTGFATIPMSAWGWAARGPQAKNAGAARVKLRD